MELFSMYSEEIVSLVSISVIMGGVLVLALAKGVDSGKFDSVEKRISTKEKRFGE